MGLETLSSKKNNLTAEFISHTFGETRFFAKNRVGSEGVTGLKTRGRPPRLDDINVVASMPQSWAEMFVVNLGSTLLLETTLETIDSLVTTMAVETSVDPIEIANAHLIKWIIHIHNVNI